MRWRPLFPEILEIEPVDRARTLQDELGQEPVRRIARKATVEIVGEFDEQTRNRRDPSEVGGTGRDRTEFRFAVRAAAALGYTPATGDRVVAVKNRDGSDRRELNLYIDEVSRISKERHGSKTYRVRLTSQAGKRRAVSD